MSEGVGVVGVYVRDQEEALAFYVGKLGFRVHTDVRNGDFRWLTVQHPDQPSFQLGLFTPGPPMLDETTAQTLRGIVAKGAMPRSYSWSMIAELPTTGCAPEGLSSRKSPSTATVPWMPVSGIRRVTVGR